MGGPGNGGGRYLLWTMLWVGVIGLIVLQSVPLLSLRCFDPGFSRTLLGAENTPLWRNIRALRFFVHRRFLWSGSFVCAAFGVVVAHSFGRPATAPWFRCLRENLKEVTFSREGWGGGRMLWRDDWVTVEAAQQHTRHLEWTAAGDRWGAEKNKAGQVPAEPCPPSERCLTRRKQMPVWSIFSLRGFKKKRKGKKAWANR